MNYHGSHEEICPKFIQILAGRAPKTHLLTNSFILVAGQDINGTHFGNRMFVHVLCALYTAENERTRKLQNDKPLSSTTIRLRAAMVLRRETLAQAFDLSESRLGDSPSLPTEWSPKIKPMCSSVPWLNPANCKHDLFPHVATGSVI